MDRLRSWKLSTSKAIRHPLNALSDTSIGEVAFVRTREKLLKALDHAVPQIARVHSPDPRDIGIAGNPPLCRACAHVFSDFRNTVDVENWLSMSSERLKVSIELGCYLCNLYYNAEWTALSPKRTEAIAPKRFRDINPAPNSVGSFIQKAMQHEQPGCFDMYLAAVDRTNPNDIWMLRLVLFPEEGVDEKMPREISGSTNVDMAAKLAANWIQNCETNHPGCRVIKDSPKWRPTRLIHIGRRGSSSNPRLCISDEIALGARYVTLSHCWGQLNLSRLTEANLDAFRKALPYEHLTNISRDALEFAQYLNVEYVWIDFLCIIQDSHDDWVRESAMMGEIYKNSWFNISATGFPDGNSSLYVTRNPATLRPQKFNLSFRKGDEKTPPDVWNGNYYCTEELWQSEITDAPANTRGWVFQERLLAPRVIHFGSRQILWECKELEACEVFPDGIPVLMISGFKSAGLLTGPSKIHGANLQVRSPDDQNDTMGNPSENVEEQLTFGVEDITLKEKGDKSNQEMAKEFHREDDKEQLDNSEKIYYILLTKWIDIAGAYNFKKLTREEDKFVAIAGLATEMQKLTNQEYIAGLWKRNLLHQLAWYVAWEGKIMGRVFRPKIYQAPSWSWACLNAPVAALRGMTSDPLASIVDYGITLADNNKFGRVINGYLRIRGRLSHATFVASDKWLSKHTNLVPQPVQLRTASSGSKNIVKPLFIPDCFPAIPKGISGPPTFPIHHALGAREFWLFPLTRTTDGCVGLVLKHTGFKGQYQRIGAFVHDDEHGDSDDGQMDLKKEFDLLFSHKPLLLADEYEELFEDGISTFTII